MASINVYTILKNKVIAPGESITHKWNNAPHGKVITLDLMPVLSYPNNVGKIELVRQWRKYIWPWTSRDAEQRQSHYELELYFEVKNIGNNTVIYNVLMSVAG